jgi:uncharacterized membrane protein YvbJ
MALIKCSECQSDVSENAQTCPHCGNPLKNPPQKVEIVEVERTSKKWKKKSLWGLAFIIVGLLLLRGEWQGVGIILIVIGFVKLIISSIGSWWTNG